MTRRTSCVALALVLVGHCVSAAEDPVLEAILHGRDGSAAFFRRTGWSTDLVRVGDAFGTGVVSRIDDDGVTVRYQDTDAPRARGREVRWRLGPPTAVATSDWKKYSGDPVSLDLRDEDLMLALFLFSDVSGRVLVIDPSAAGRVSLSLRDVPWDYALTRILEPTGLGYRLDALVLWIAPPSALPAAGLPPRAYGGDPIRLEFVRPALLEDLLGLFADISGLFVSVPPELVGRHVIVKCRDAPWDLVLDALLLPQGFGTRVEGNRLLFIPRADP